MKTANSILLLVLMSCFAFPIMSYGGKKPKYKVVTSEWDGYTQEQIAGTLEKTKEQIDYCLKNIGKKFLEVDLSMIGDDSRSTFGAVGVVTYGLVAYKYRDAAKSAEYFYKDWLELKKCEDARAEGVRMEGCFSFGNGPGDYSPLASAIGQWSSAGLYPEALKHYDEYYDYNFFLHMRNMGDLERKRQLKAELSRDSELAKRHADFLREWQRLKRLSKTAKPRPLDPPVQHHEWFYSDKQEEVLKSLGYYFKHKVRFMLEKALSHKDPAIAATSREYLEKLGKGEKNETETKKP